MLLLLSVVVGIATLGLLSSIQRRRAAHMDAQRVTYLLNFPSELDHERVIAWLRATSRTLASSRLFGSQSMVFETLATETGISHRLMVPKSKADDVIPQLRALVPGASATPTKPEQLAWTTAVEIGLTNKSLPLSIPAPNDTSTSILASLQPLRVGEAILVQWVITSALGISLPDKNSQSNQFKLGSFIAPTRMSDDELRERRFKLDEPNVMGVLRVAAKGKTEPRAEQLIDRVRTSYKAAETPHNHWYKVLSSRKSVIERIKTAASKSQWPAQLNMAELSALVGWPIGSPNVSGLPRGASRQLPAPQAVPRTGIVLGTSNFPGDDRKVALDYGNSAKHTWIVGPTGVGKTVLLSNMATQIMDTGHGMLLIETKNDLFQSVLNHVPRERLSDVIVMDVDDHTNPVGFNILEDGDPARVIDDLESIVSSIHGDEKNIWLKEVMYHSLKTLITLPGATIADLPALLAPRYDEVDWREQVVRNLTDPELLHFWQRMDNQGRARQDQITAPVLSRFWHFNSRQSVRNIFGQRTSSFNMDDVVKDGKILLVNLTGVDRDTTKIVGSMLVNSAWKAVRKHQLEKPFYLVADEAQNIMHLPISMDDMLAQARSFKFPIIMANQAAHQLPPNVRDAALANARTKIAFQLEVADAKLMAAQFGTRVDENDFMKLQAYECIARIATDSGVSEPVTLRASPPMSNRGLAGATRAASRTAFGRPVHQVEDEISSWRRVSEEAKKSHRPTISGEDWNT